MYKFWYNHEEECLMYKVVNHSGGTYLNFEKEYFIADIPVEEAKDFFLEDMELNRKSWLYKYSEDYLCEMEYNIKNADILEEDEDDW